MKKSLLLTSSLILSLLIQAFAQVPQKISYQAVIRNADGTVAANQNYDVRVVIRVGSEVGTQAYAEQFSVTTDPQGKFWIPVGAGTPILGSFQNIAWLQGAYLQLLLKKSGETEFRDYGTSQILTVPYALYSQSALNGIQGTSNAGATATYDGTKWSGTNRIFIDSNQVVITPKEGYDKELPFFVVKNSEGKAIFEVYEYGVRFFVAEGDVKGAKGGFAVGGLTGGKQDPIYYMQINPGRVDFTIDDSYTEKGAKGGFAVGGLTNGKATDLKFFDLTPERIEFRIVDTVTTKGAKGGFAVGGLTNGKSTELSNFLEVTRDSTYIMNTILSTGDMLVTGQVQTNVGLSSLPVTDKDGNTYQTVKIGTKIWMKENLRTTTYETGNPIPLAYYYTYNNATNLDSIITFGRYYTPDAVQSPENVCPSGWHVANYVDWEELFLFVGGANWQDSIRNLEMVQKIAEPGTTDDGNGYWIRDMRANNVTGFSARPTGWVDMYNGLFFKNIHERAVFWAADSYETITIYNETGILKKEYPTTPAAFPIRCVKN